MPYRLLPLGLVLLSLTSCDSRDGFDLSVGFERDPPSPVIAGQSFAVRAIGVTGGTFEGVRVLVFRGSPQHDTDEGLTGDTLAVVPLDVESGSTSFDVPVTVTVPAEAVTQPQPGSIYIEFRNGGCRPGCTGATGSSLELVPPQS